MNAEASTRGDHIKAGVFWLIVLLGLGYVFPRFVGAVLMLFSALVFVLAVVGLTWPSLIRLPNRLASVWVFAVSVGLFMGGGVLMIPNNGESTASDEPQSAVAEEAPAPVARTDGRLAARLADAEARAACNVRLTDAARVLFYQGAVHRWTETDLEARFGRRLSADPDVLVYFGNALEFMNEDGSWVRAFYECDWNTETGEIVDVRVQPTEGV